MSHVVSRSSRVFAVFLMLSLAYMPFAALPVVHAQEASSTDPTVTDDTTPPVITLNGDATVNLTIGDTWTDPSATATDDVDITDPVTVGGDTVDTSTAGTYTITYDAVDAAGNHAIQVTRTVIVSAPNSDATTTDDTNTDDDNGGSGGGPHVNSLFVPAIKVLTSLTVATTTVVYGDTPTFSATLTDGDGNPIVGEKIKFSISLLGGLITIPTQNVDTDNNGVASYTGSLPDFAPVGTYLGVIGASFKGDSSYAKSSGSGDFIVTPRPLTVTGITASDKPYDGTTTATIDTTNAALVGVLSHGLLHHLDDVALDVSGATGAFSDPNPGTGKTVTISGLALTGSDAGNYEITPPTTTADITGSVPSTPSVTTDDATNVTVSDATLNGTDGPVDADNTSFWWGTTDAGPFTPDSDPAGHGELPSGWQHDTGLGGVSAGSSFSENLPGLTPSTTYYYAAWVEVGGIWYPGDVKTVTTGSIPTCSSDDTTFDTFANGSVNGQDGWSATGSYDQAIVDNTYGFSNFGCKSLRISDAVTTGSFGDQTFSYSTPNEAGETDADNGGYSGGTRQNHFDAQFDIASTMLDEQPGMALSVSPDRGDGARMSYLRFEDQADGIHVFFDDVTDPTHATNADTFNEMDIATLDRSTTHTIKFSMDFIDGPDNDVVNIYIDGNLVHTGTSWEDYYRYDTESNPTLVDSSRTVDSLLFREGGTAHPADAGKGFLIDNVILGSSMIPTVTVTIDKFLDGSMATAASANSASFPMVSSWDAANLGGVGNGSYNLDTLHPYSPNAYEAITNPMDLGSSYATNEVVDGTTVGADCSTGAPYALLGYSTGATLADAESASVSSTSPNFTDLQSDEHVIVWNATCPPPDTTPPTVMVTPDPSTILHGTETFDITVHDDNPLDPSKNTHVWVYLYDNGGTQKHAGANVDLSSGTGTFTVDTTQLDDGAATLDVGQVYDAAGNVSGASDNYFSGYVIDNTGPVVSVIPAAGSTLSGTVTFTITVTDPHLDPSILTHIWTYLYNNLPPQADKGANIDLSSGTGTFTVDTTQLANGTSTLDVGKLYDALGNPSGTGDSYFSNYMIDNDLTPPSVPTLLSPTNGSDLDTNDFDFTWDPSTDDHAGTIEYDAQFTLDPTEVGGVLQNGIWDSITNGGDTLTSPMIHSSGAADGTWYWQVRAKDAAGNWSGWSDIWSVTLDTQAPGTPTIMSPADGSILTTANMTDVTWSDESDSGTPVSYIYQAATDAGFTNIVYTSPALTSPEIATPGTPEGVYYVRVMAEDAAGNESGWSDPVKVTIDNTAPEIDLDGANPMNLIVGDTYAEPGYTATDNVDGDLTGDVVVGGDTVDTSAPGVYDVTYTVTDTAGNSTEVTRVVTVSDVDAPVITLNGDAHTYVTFGTTYTDAGATAHDDVDGDVPVVTSGTVDTSNKGDYTITYTATDSSGNTATAARLVTVTYTPHNGGGSGPTPNNENTGGDGQVLGASTFNFTVDFGLGSTLSPDVTELQKILIADGYLDIPTPTGYFGSATEAAVKLYQAANGIPETGFVGPLTRNALNNGTIVSSDSDTSDTIADLLQELQDIQNELDNLS